MCRKTRLVAVLSLLEKKQKLSLNLFKMQTCFFFEKDMRDRVPYFSKR